MSRLSGSIRLVSEKPPIVAPSEKTVDNLFAFNKGISITANDGYEVILRPEVHGFDIRIKTPRAVNLNNFAVRAKDLKLPKTGDYFVTFDVKSSVVTNIEIATDINDKQTNRSPVTPTTTGSKYLGVHKDINPDAYKDHGINGGFIDFNIIRGNLNEGIVIHIENIMIGAGDKEAPFSRPIEDIVANALNGIDRQPVVARRFLATKNFDYKNGKEVDANDGVAYLDFIVPRKTKTSDYTIANMYMCLEPMRFNEDPDEDAIKQTGKWKLVNRKAIEQIDTLISHTIDTSNLSAQRVIFKSGNTLKGVITGTPGSSVTSDASGDNVKGNPKYYMWLGSDIPESAPFSIDVDGNVKIGGKASFQRTSRDVTSSITITTDTRDSLFNVIDTKQTSITITIDGGDYSNKEFEFTSMSNISNISNGGFQLRAGDNIKFIYGDKISKLIYVNYIGKSVRLRHIKTNIYGTVENYLVVTNASDFTYDNYQGIILNKPIEYPGTRYDISVSIKNKYFYFKNKNLVVNDNDNVFINTNISDELKRVGISTSKIELGDIRVTVSVVRYFNRDNASRDGVGEDKPVNNDAIKTATAFITGIGQAYFLESGSGTNIGHALINIDLNKLSSNYLNNIIAPMSAGNSVVLIWNEISNNTIGHAWAIPLCEGKEINQDNYINHSLIISPKAYMEQQNEDGTDEQDIVVFNGTLYINH